MLKYPTWTTLKAFRGTLAAMAFVAVAAGGMGPARASSFDLGSIGYATVATALANSESLGAGFDIQLQAAVGNFGVGGSDLFAAFKFSNPTQAQGGSAPSLSGSQARIHEIYFESGLNQFIDSTVLYRSDTTSPMYNGTTLSPGSPPGINPAWTGGTYVWFDEGSGATGVGEGDFFEVIFALAAGKNFNTNDLLHNILGNGNIPARIAMHIGDCDLENSCVIDTWPPSVIPLPAAFPLYGTGLALIGLVGWRKKRKAART